MTVASTTLNILSTNDLHSALEQWPKVTGVLKRKRTEAEQAGEEVLLFDIGDHSDRVHPVTEALKGKANTHLLNEMTYDGVTIGNNEGITFSKEDLNTLYDDAVFPVILCNLFHLDGSRPVWASPSVVKTMDSGVKIGVTGATVPFRQFYEPLGWSVTDPVTSLKEETDKLKETCDFIICLSHLGYSEDEYLAAHNPDIDLILGSHTHHVLKEGIEIDGTWINQSGKGGSYIGEAKIMISSSNGASPELSVESVKSLSVMEEPEDSDTAKSVELLKKRADRLLEEPVTVLKSKLDVDWFKPSPFANLLAHTVKEWCEADVSMVNAGVLLHSIGPGVVTKGDLHDLCPHPINPVIVAISGDQLLETIRQARSDEMTHFQLKGFGFRGKVLGHMAFDGLEIKGAGSYISDQHVRIEGVPIERRRIYSLATLDMFTLGRLYPPVSSTLKKTYFMPEFLRDLLTWKLAQVNGKHTMNGSSSGM